MSIIRKYSVLSNVLINCKKITSSMPKIITRSRCYSQLMCHESLLKDYHRATWIPQVASVHTKGDQELVEFLEEEIKAEVESTKSAKLPSVKGFNVKAKEAEIIMTKQFNNENITVKMNVNHAVDAEEPQQFREGDKDVESGEMKCKPNFNVEIDKNGNKLIFSCSLTSEPTPEEATDSYTDAFQITELTMYTKEWEDETYTVAGDIMDGYMYDLLMNMLDERGIGAEFADSLVKYCTSYEHGLYVGLLQNLKDFVLSK